MTDLRARRLACREVVELVSDYLDNALAPSERARVEAHLETCPECIAYLAQLRTTIGAVGRLGGDEVPVGSRERSMRVPGRWRA